MSKQIVMLLGLFLTVTVLGLLSVGYLFTVSDNTIRVTDYVCKTCSDLNHWLSDESFNESISFDYQIVSSVSAEDAVLYIEDELGNRAELYRGTHSLTCKKDSGGWSYAVQRFRGGVGTYMVSVDNDYATFASETGELSNRVEVSALTPPYHLSVIVKEARGTVCHGNGASYRDGMVEVTNIVVLDIIPEDPVDDTVVVTDPVDNVTDPVDNVTDPVDNVTDPVDDIVAPLTITQKVYNWIYTFLVWIGLK